MKPITLTVTVDSDALLDLLTAAMEKGPKERTQAVSQGTEQPPVDVESAAKSKTVPLEASQDVVVGGQKPSDERGLLVDTRQACKLLRVSSRTLWTMYTSGQMPRPIRIGRAVRWSYAELRAWVTAGCPKQAEWKWPR